MPIVYAENPWKKNSSQGMEPNILKLAAGTTNQVSSGAKHPVTWKRDILFGVLRPR